jgi:ATP-dependent RNA helicase DHX57
MRSFCEDNFVNFNTIRDITSLRQDFQAALAEIGLIDFPGRGPRRDEAMEEWNVNSENENLLKAILVGAFWPRIVRIRLPDAKFEKVQAGSVAKEHEAREVKYYDSVDNSRVFIVSPRNACGPGESLDVEITP